MNFRTIGNNLQSLSIDVVVGSICSLAFGARILQSTIPIWWYIAFPMAVWVIYTTDHLLDAKNLQTKAVNPRHHFHQQFYKSLTLAVLLVGIVVTVLVLFNASLKLLRVSLLLFSGSVLYLILISLRGKNRLFFQKEILISLIYTAGIWMGPINWFEKRLTFEIALVICSFAITTLTEIILINTFEMQTDKLQGNPSMATKFGNHSVKKWLFIGVILHLLVLCLFIILQTGILQIVFGILLIMNLVLIFLMLFPKLVAQNGVYHLIGELVFWLPALLLLW